MKQITPEDATRLALIAEHPRMSENDLRRIIGDIVDSDMKLAARAIVELSLGRPYSHLYTSDQISTAECLVKWVTENRTLMPS